MCGRFVSTQSRYALSAYFGVADVVGEELPASYNVAPTDSVYAVAAGRGGRRLGTMRWGLMASWSGGPGRQPRPINARAETLLAKPMFAEALARRRCVVPADGYYEWTRTASASSGEAKQPFFITSADGQPLAFAGLWARWTPPDGAPAVLSCAVVTTAANKTVAALHHRMPALLDADGIDAWLDRSQTDGAELCRLLVPAPIGLLVAKPADPRVNRVANNDPGLIRA